MSSGRDAPQTVGPFIIPTSDSARARRHRRFFAGICWVLAGVLLGFGGPFLIAGTRATALPPAYEFVTRYLGWAGGMHAYGGIMVVLSLSLMHGLLPAAHGRTIFYDWIHVTLGTITGFAAGAVLAFLGSMLLTGTLTFQAMIYWASIATISLLCTLFAPDPPDGPGVWHELLARALADGADNAPSPETPLGAIAAFLVSVTALIGAITGLLATARGFLRRRREEAEAEPPSPNPPISLNSDSAHDDEHLTAEERRIKRLEAFCWQNHMNPTLIVSGNERMADVHFN